MYAEITVTGWQLNSSVHVKLDENVLMITQLFCRQGDQKSVAWYPCMYTV